MTGCARPSLGGGDAGPTSSSESFVPNLVANAEVQTANSMVLGTIRIPGVPGLVQPSPKRRAPFARLKPQLSNRTRNVQGADVGSLG